MAEITPHPHSVLMATYAVHCCDPHGKPSLGWENLLEKGWTVVD